MKLLIISNYPKDQQESMLRFARLLERIYSSVGYEVSVISPPVFFSFIFSRTHSGLAKWMGYLDKYVLMPFCLLFLRLRYLRSSNLYFHIADHSNAPYLFWLPKNKTIITCHDVLAIRGAIGYPDAYCTTSFTGKILQQWILNNLLRAPHIAAVSETTLSLLIELADLNRVSIKNWRVVYNALNAEFKPVQSNALTSYLNTKTIPVKESFLLHVGSNLARKNRILLLQMILELGDRFKGKIIYAGAPLNEELLEFIQTHQLTDRIISIEKPEHDLLAELYTTCAAFIFPSFSEGFGWPVIEAQACGAPVITSTIAPMPEIGGVGALYASPSDARSFAEAYLQLKDADFRSELVKAGLENVKRFSDKQMLNGYQSFFSLSSQ